jgi:hypothetical protein
MNSYGFREDISKKVKEEIGDRKKLKQRKGMKAT